jgi:hypothetical protein
MNPCIHSFQNLLSELTRVQLFMLQILYMDSFRPGPRKGEKDPLKLQMESKPKLKLLAMSIWSKLMVLFFFLEMFLCSFVEQKLD